MHQGSPWRGGLQKRGRRLESVRAVCALILDLLFPRTCPFCGGVLPFSTPWERARAERRVDFYVCPACAEQLPYLLKKPLQEEAAAAEELWLEAGVSVVASPLCLRPICAKCGRPLSKLQAQTQAGPLCSGCRQHVRLFQRCICLFPYEDQLRRVLAGVKYRHERQAMEALGELAAQQFAPLLLALHPDALVPVPVHRKRLRERGYNQAAVFCSVLAARTGIPMAEWLLRREKNTKAQKELGAAGRMKNLQNAFQPGRCPAGQSVPERVLLVDDIYTTGATLEACTETLFEAGVKEVYGLCICGAAEQAG